MLIWDGTSVCERVELKEWYTIPTTTGQKGLTHLKMFHYTIQNFYIRTCSYINNITQRCQLMITLIGIHNREGHRLNLERIRIMSHARQRLFKNAQLHNELKSTTASLAHTASTDFSRAPPSRLNTVLHFQVNSAVIK